MKRSLVNEVSKTKGNVKIRGWVHELRDLAKIKFFLLRDPSGIIQCIVKDNKLFKGFTELTLESVIEVEGKVNKTKIKSDLAVKDAEVEISSLKLLNKAESLPILVNEKTITTGLSKRLDNRSLDVRKPKIHAIFKIQSTITNAFREFFFNNNFLEIHPPGIIATSTEGGTELFKLEYFGKPAFLAQSPQLYKQLIAISLEKVFSTSTVWRAEKHNTVRHLNEIRQLDIEVAFADEFTVMKYLEHVLQYIVKKVMKENQEEIGLLDIKLAVPKAKYMSYKEAIEVLQKHKYKIKYGDDFEPEDERKLCNIYRNTIIFTHDWPQALKPFYIWPKNGTSGGFDAVYGGMEIASGGQRVHVPEILIKQLKVKGLKPENFKWYIDAFRYGAPKHAGWSIGLERLTMIICNLENIREACIFPRDRERITP